MDYFQHLNSLNIYEKDSQFFVKGQIGNWRNQLSAEQSKRFDEAVSQNLKYKGLIDYGSETETKS
jgi:hypothetical protein